MNIRHKNGNIKDCRASNLIIDRMKAYLAKGQFTYTVLDKKTGTKKEYQSCKAVSEDLFTDKTNIHHYVSGKTVKKLFLGRYRITREPNSTRRKTG